MSSRVSMISKVLLALGLLAPPVLLLAPLRHADAADPPPDFVDVPVAGEIWAPVQIEMAPDGRLVVLEDAGRARIIVDDVMRPTPLFDIRGQVDDVADRGLLSLAFDNQFAANGFIYVVYTYDTNGTDDGVGRTRLSRFTVTGDVAGNEVVVFDRFPDADVALHYGGAVEMGPDGRLYVAVGDHLLGSNGQNRSNLKGTVLRLNTDGTIPTDNPFYDELTGDSRAIYAYGLRNPWQTAKDPVTGRILISDVGSDDWEELNELEAGANYGWFVAEGPADPNDPAQAGFTDPIWAFPHFGVDPAAPFSGCAIIGGAFYETPNPTFPVQLRGQYFTGDYCTGTMLTLDTATGVATPFMSGFDELVDMAVSPVTGELYYLDRSFNGDQQFPKGGIGKISYTGQVDNITITTHPSDVSIAAGGAASFFVGVSAPGDVSYQWFRDGSPLVGAVAAQLVVTDIGPADDGAVFTVEVSDGVETVTSNPATISLTTNTVPVPTIDSVATTFQAGVPVSFSGSATDAEDGVVPGGDLTWSVRLNHAQHDHELLSGIVGTTGSFTVPAAIETDTDVWVTVYLTATDSDGTAWTTSARVDPVVVTVTIDTSPNGLDVTFEGATESTPFVFDSVAGVQREFSALASQPVGPETYTFTGWSDAITNGDAHPTPTSDATIVATYVLADPDVCTVEVLSPVGVRVSWQNKPGTEVIRNSKGWVTTPPAGSTAHDEPTGVLDGGWLIRRSGVDEICLVIGDPPPPPPPPACVTTAVVAGGVLIEWSPIPGENRYQVRVVGGGWLATVDGATDYSYPGGSLAEEYEIRYDLDDGNGKQTFACANEGDPPPPPLDDTCAATDLPGGGVSVTWTDKQGTEVIRNAAGWVITPPAGTSEYIDFDGAAGDGWLIRRSGVDEICDINP